MLLIFKKSIKYLYQENNEIVYSVFYAECPVWNIATPATTPAKLSTKNISQKTTVPATKPSVTKYTGDPGIIGIPSVRKTHILPFYNVNTHSI